MKINFKEFLTNQEWHDSILILMLCTMLLGCIVYTNFVYVDHVF